jgi:hypothetical protein
MSREYCKKHVWVEHIEEWDAGPLKGEWLIRHCEECGKGACDLLVGMQAQGSSNSAPTRESC